MTAEDYAKKWLGAQWGMKPEEFDSESVPASIVDDLALMFKEAMRDQRHACAEALSDCGTISDGEYAGYYCDQAHQAVMNAEPK